MDPPVTYRVGEVDVNPAVPQQRTNHLLEAVSGGDPQRALSVLHTVAQSHSHTPVAQSHSHTSDARSYART
eukprot:2821486-Pyramimonas_sp.AAC.1